MTSFKETSYIKIIPNVERSSKGTFSFLLKLYKDTLSHAVDWQLFKFLFQRISFELIIAREAFYKQLFYISVNCWKLLCVHRNSDVRRNYNYSSLG